MARRFTPALSARLFTLFTGAVVVFQLALLAGAPWGALTQGGRTSGVLPDGARAVAAFSAVLLMAFILVVRARAGLRVPTWRCAQVGSSGVLWPTARLVSWPMPSRPARSSA